MTHGGEHSGRSAPPPGECDRPAPPGDGRRKGPMTDGGPAGAGPSLAARAMLAAIRAYQLTLSFIMGRWCRHLPTCSEYTATAIGTHGAWAGFWLGLSRVGRCHPWGSHGFDPVPETLPAHGWRFWRYLKVRGGAPPLTEG